MFKKAGKRLDADYCSVLRQLEVELEKETKAQRFSSIADSFYKIGRRADYDDRQAMMQDSYTKAGNLFVELKNSKRAAEAFEAAGLVELAMEQSDKVDKPTRSALEIALAGGLYKDAADMLLATGEVRRAIDALEDGGLYEQALLLHLWGFSDLDAAVKPCLDMKSRIRWEAYTNVITVSTSNRVCVSLLRVRGSRRVADSRSLLSPFAAREESLSPG